jgi:Uma2 family endonuclease
MSVAIPTDAVPAAELASKKMSFEEFLEFDDGTDYSYELEDGKLILMMAESEINRRIESFLFAFFLQTGIPYYRLRMKSEIAVQSGQVGVRIPDLMVLSEELAVAMEGSKRSLILMDMPPPLLVVEVVSPGQENRDYRYKRSEYAARGIAEYWIVDAIAEKVTILEWVEGFYNEQVFETDKLIVSPLFGNLKLSAAQILKS